MYRNIVFIICSFLFSGELEVDGGLTVTEGVTASSFVGNGVGLTGIGIKPEKIYTHISNNEYFSFTVPENKVWYVEITLTSMSTMSRIKINHIQLDLINGNYKTVGNPSFVLQPGYNLENVDYQGTYGKVVLSIYEYSISGSGTDQGMDYIEP